MHGCRKFHWLAAAICAFAPLLQATPTINAPDATPPGLQSDFSCSPGNTPTKPAAITSGVNIPGGFCIYVNGQFNTSAQLTVTWKNTVTGVTQNLQFPPGFGISATQLQVVVPQNLFLTPVATQQPVTITVSELVSTVTTTDSATFTVNPPFSVPTQQLKAATYQVPYSRPIATGGTPPFAISTGGSLPPGLTVQPDVTLAGTPTALGQYEFGVAASDTWDAGFDTNFAIQVVDTPSLNLPITPAVVSAGSPGFTLSVTGSKFVPVYTSSVGSDPNSLIEWGTGGVTSVNPLVTNFVNSGQLTATVPQGLLVQPGTATVLVAQPSGALSNPGTILINGPTASAISPNPITARNTPVTFSLFGSNFVQNPGLAPAQSTIIGVGQIPTTFVNSTTLQGTQTFSTAGTFPVQVINPGGSASNFVNITVQPAPTITSLSPNPANAGATFNLTVNGANFTQGMTVMLNGVPLQTTFQGSGSLVATVLGALIPSTGSASITVITSDQYQTAAATLAINSAFRITTASLPAATSGSSYDAFVQATGGKPPYLWTASGLPSGLSINRSTGEITGTVNTSNSFTVDVTATDSNQQRATATFFVSVALPTQPIRIDSGGPLPTGVVGAAYTAFINANGGAGETLTLTATGLPPGLSMNSSGLISGTPTTAGTFNFTVQVSDGNGNSATAGFTIVVKPAPLTVTGPATIAPVPVGSAVNIKFGATGGVPPYSFNFSGNLPDGTTFGRDGTLSGTATAQGTFAFTIFATDSTGVQASKSFSITVTAPTLSISASLGDGQVGVAYAGKVSASGGQPPYTISVSGLPDGLTFSNGAVSGTPAKAGAFTVAISATDSAAGKASLSVTVNIAPAALTVTGTLGNGTVGSSYSGTLSASGGVPPYQFTFSGLPAGLAGGSDGTVGGTPTTAGTFTVTATVADARQNTATQKFTVTIAAPPLTLTVPTIANATVGSAVSATFSASGGVPPYTFSATGLPSGFTLSSGGALSGTPTAPGTSSFIVTVKDSAGTATSQTVPLTIVLPATPGFTVTGLPATSNPATQSTVQIGVTSPYPVDITVVLTLTFAADSGPDDPTVQFATGGRTATVTIPAGQTSAATGIGVQTGTVAGTATITARLSAASQDITPTPVPTRTVRIAPGPPTVTNVTATASGSGFTVTVIGFATTREIRQAVFTVNLVSGSNPSSQIITIDVSSLFSAWYGSAASAQFGSQFTYTQPFNVTGGLSNIANVSVTLVSGAGSSTPATVTIH